MFRNVMELILNLIRTERLEPYLYDDYRVSTVEHVNNCYSRYNIFDNVYQYTQCHNIAIKTKQCDMILHSTHTPDIIQLNTLP